MLKGSQMQRLKALAGEAADREHGLAAICLLSLLYLTTCAGPAGFMATCVRVPSGSIIAIRVGGERMRVRLEGVQTPEPGQDFADQAKEFTASLVHGNEVLILPKRGSGVPNQPRDVEADPSSGDDARLLSVQKDQNGRIVARVEVDGKDVSLELLRAGLAWHYQRFSGDPGLAAAEKQARAKQIGIWSLPDPIPPWRWKESRKKAESK